MGIVKFSTGLVAFKPQGTNQTPQQIGLASDISVDFDQEKILVYGQKKVAIDSFDGKLSIKGSLKMGAWGAQTFAAVVGGSTTATGSKVGILDEQFTVPTTPFKVTVANGATFFEDLGVIDMNTGLAMIRGATSTGTGVYAVNEGTGEYTFNTADAAHVVRISYSYTAAAVGKTVSYTNALMGQSAQFQLSAFNSYGTKKYGYRFPAVVFDKFSPGMKMGAIGDASISFQAIEESTTGKPFDIFEMD
jgi:hypothetical protein